MVKCLIMSIIMHNSEHIYKIFRVPGDASFSPHAGLCDILAVPPEPPGLRGGASPSPHASERGARPFLGEDGAEIQRR